jgi:hypothetical protein
MYEFTLDETREICYNQALLKLMKLPKLNLSLVKELGFYLNMLTEDQFIKLQSAVVYDTSQNESLKDNLFG